MIYVTEARNSTVNFPLAAVPPSREDILARAVAEGACYAEGARSRTDTTTKSLGEGKGFMAEIYQCNETEVEE